MRILEAILQQMLKVKNTQRQFLTTLLQYFGPFFTLLNKIKELLNERLFFNQLKYI